MRRLSRDLRRRVPHVRTLARHQVQRVLPEITTDRLVRLIDEAGDVRREPVVAARETGLIADPLLDDAPFTRGREEEGVVIELVPVLHRGVVDLRGHSARVHQRIGVATNALTRGDDLCRRFA